MKKNYFLSTLLSPIKGRFLYAKKVSRWKKMNQHNFTDISEHCPIECISVGIGTYGKINAHWYGDENERLIIGNYCSIASEVHFIMGGEHDYKRFMLYPFRELLIGSGCDGICKGPIILEDDVWIGFGTIVLSGVTIGKGSVIGAGSIVTKNVPPYSIWMGNSVVDKRFDEDIISEMLDINVANINVMKYSELAMVHANMDKMRLFNECIGKNREQ